MSQKLASIAEPQKETPEKDEEFVLVPIHSVQVDALVALKIEKHAKENYPNSTTGALFGIDKDGVLEISNCSRFLNSFHADEDNQVHVQYQIEIMQQLRAVNFDSHTVGWYQASSLANFINLFWLNHQLDFQTSIPNSVVLEFDTLRSNTGQFSLRAFQLTDAFVQVLKTRTSMKLFSDSISSAGCLKKGWLIELPVTVRAPMFVSVLAHELHWNSLHVSPQLPSTQYYEKQVLGLTDTMDTLIQEQTKYHSWQRHYAREKQRVDFLLRQKKEDLDRKSILAKLPFEPNRMETLLVSQHLVQQTQQVVQGLPSSMFAIELAKQATSANI